MTRIMLTKCPACRGEVNRISTLLVKCSICEKQWPDPIPEEQRWPMACKAFADLCHFEDEPTAKTWQEHCDRLDLALEAMQKADINGLEAAVAWKGMKAYLKEYYDE